MAPSLISDPMAPGQQSCAGIVPENCPNSFGEKRTCGGNVHSKSRRGEPTRRDRAPNGSGKKLTKPLLRTLCLARSTARTTPGAIKWAQPQTSGLLRSGALDEISIPINRLLENGRGAKVGFKDKDSTENKRWRWMLFPREDVHKLMSMLKPAAGRAPRAAGPVMVISPNVAANGRADQIPGHPPRAKAGREAPWAQFDGTVSASATIGTPLIAGRQAPLVLHPPGITTFPGGLLPKWQAKTHVGAAGPPQKSGKHRSSIATKNRKPKNRKDNPYLCVPSDVGSHPGVEKGIDPGKRKSLWGQFPGRASAEIMDVFKDGHRGPRKIMWITRAWGKETAPS